MNHPNALASAAEHLAALCPAGGAIETAHAMYVIEKAVNDGDYGQPYKTPDAWRTARDGRTGDRKQVNLREIAVIGSTVAVMAACGESSSGTGQAHPTPPGWTASTLSTVMLPGSDFPSPFQPVPDNQGDGGAFDLQRMEADTPPGILSDTLRKDNPAAGYRRNWRGPSLAVGYVQLTAFHTKAAAVDYASAFAAFLQVHGQAATAAPDLAPDALAYVASGPGGEGYSIIVSKDGVVVQVAVGGPGVAWDVVKRLTKEQLQRL